MPADQAAPTNRMDALRDRLLDAALPNVLFDGWTRRSLVEGARAEGLPAEDVDIAFPLGVRDAVGHWLDRADAQMADDMRAHGLDGLKIREKVALGVRLRLERAEPHKEAVRRGLSFLALPGNGGLAARSLYRTVDTIWRECGDTSTDYNFYTKRGLLAAVYSSTLLYWLDDASDGHGDTWAFLDRRIADVMKVPKITARLKSIGGYLPGPGRFTRAWKAARRAPA
ncbi:MAG: COQ9 family protein [Alphaproteobacteria bacterium]|nr:COQ9 family protein [Alphaproteobacteria bacterium]